MEKKAFKSPLKKFIDRKLAQFDQKTYANFSSSYENSANTRAFVDVPGFTFGNNFFYFFNNF